MLIILALFSGMVGERMRGRSTLGATFFTVVAGYARQLDAVGGRRSLAGVAIVTASPWRRASALQG